MATDAPVTIYNSLDDIYVPSSILAQGKRWNDLAVAFESEYGRKPSHIVRAPGRINLIGEHIDYCLFGVMPAAVEMDVLIALSVVDPSASFSSSPPTIQLANILPSYPKTTITPTSTSSTSTWDVSLRKKNLTWDGYLRAALLGVLNTYLPPSASLLPKSMDLMISGSIPPGSGLSSSAALIVASLLAFLTANSLLPGFTNAQLVQLARESEAAIGVNSGGMDQSASVLSRSSAGLFVWFWPELGCEEVPLPSIWNSDGTEEKPVLVISNSLTTHDLAGSASTRYNLRVVETLLAARVLLHQLGLGDKVEPSHRVTLREVLAIWADGRDLPEQGLEDSLVALIKKVDKVFSVDDGRNGWSRETCWNASGLEKGVFDKVYFDFLEVQADKFQLHKRATHILTESLRVLQFRRISLSAAATTSSSSSPAVELLGGLMDASHESCRDMYECSNEQMDELREVCKRAGAIGSRLSGAGWGGCIVSLVPSSRLQRFISQITDKDNGYSTYRTLGKDELEGAVFASVPGSGAGGELVRMLRVDLAEN